MFAKYRQYIVSFLVRIFNSIGFFIISPFLSLWLLKVKGLNLNDTSFIVASFTLSSKAGSVLVAGIIDHLGFKLSINIGLFLSSLILFLITWTKPYILIVLLTILLGIAISLYNISLKAHISNQEDQVRLQSYALLNIAVNVGAAMGPLIAGVIFDWNPKFLLLLSMSNYFVAGMISMFLPRDQVKPKNTDKNVINFLIEERRSIEFRIFIRFILLSSLFWFLYTQIFTTLPMYLSDNMDAKIIGLLFTLNSITVISVQGVFPKLRNNLSSKMWYLVAVLLISSSFLLLWTSKSVFLVMLAIVLFSISEIIWVPSVDHELSSLRGSLSSSWAFGISGVIWGVFESAGSYFGLNVFKQFGDATFLILSLIGFIIFTIFLKAYSVEKTQIQESH